MNIERFSTENIFKNVGSSKGFVPSGYLYHWVITGPEFRLNVKTFFQLWYFHYKDKTFVRPSYLYNGNSYTGKMISLYWVRPLLVRKSDYFHRSIYPFPSNMEEHEIKMHIYMYVKKTTWVLVIQSTKEILRCHFFILTKIWWSRIYITIFWASLKITHLFLPLIYIRILIGLYTSLKSVLPSCAPAVTFDMFVLWKRG